MFLLALIYGRRKRLKRQKKIKMRIWKIYTKRQTKGEFNSLVEYLMLFNHFYFFRMFRMNPSRVEELLSWVAPSIIKSSKFRDVATSSKRLCMILQYFATGDAQAKLLSCYRVSPPAESRKTETVAQRCSVK